MKEHAVRTPQRASNTEIPIFGDSSSIVIYAAHANVPEIQATTAGVVICSTVVDLKAAATMFFAVGSLPQKAAQSFVEGVVVYWNAVMRLMVMQCYCHPIPVAQKLFSSSCCCC